MKRRAVLSGAGGIALGVALPAAAQTATRVARIGVLRSVPVPSLSDNPRWFWDELKRLGWEPDRNLDVTFRFGLNDPKRYQAAADEMAAARVDLIYAIGDDALEAAARSSKTIPIVMIAAAAVEMGYAQSLAHPGGNVTGVVTQALDFIGRSFGLLRTLRPDLDKIGVSHRPGHRLSELWLKGWQDVGAGQGATMVPLPFLRNLSEIDPMLAIAKRAGVQALVGEGPVPILLGSGFDKIQAWATKNKVLTYTTTWVRGQHLLSFGPAPLDLARIALGQIDRILRGAKAGDIPIQQPTRFDLIVSQKIASAMGLTIPQSVLLQATEVIS